MWIVQRVRIEFLWHQTQVSQHFIQGVDPPFSACLKCKESSSVLLVIDSKSVMTVETDTFGPKFPRIKSLKSLKSMLGKEPN